MAEIESIRWRHFREGVSVRGPAREFQRSRRTIRRALADPGPWEYRRQRLGPCPVLDPVAKVIAGWLEQDQLALHKQRHTAHRICECLVTEYEFAGGESSVRRRELGAAVGARAAAEGERDADFGQRPP